MPALPYIGAAAAVIGTYSTIKQRQAQGQAVEAQNKAYEDQAASEGQRADAMRKGEEIKSVAASRAAQKERVQTVRAGIIERQRIAAAANNMGVGESSGASGSQTSVISQVGANIGNINVAESFAKAAGDANQAAADAASRGFQAGVRGQVQANTFTNEANQWGALKGLASTYADFTTIFGGNTFKGTGGGGVRSGGAPKGIR